MEDKKDEDNVQLAECIKKKEEEKEHKWESKSLKSPVKCKNKLCHMKKMA